MAVRQLATWNLLEKLGNLRYLTFCFFRGVSPEFPVISDPSIMVIRLSLVVQQHLHHKQYTALKVQWLQYSYETKTNYSFSQSFA
jgi:hypothetical protein